MSNVRRRLLRVFMFLGLLVLSIKLYSKFMSVRDGDIERTLVR